MKTITTVMTTLLAPVIASAMPQITYPQAPTDNTVDNYFGIQVPDPFRPLENDTAAVTLGWVKAENAVTDA